MIALAPPRVLAALLELGGGGLDARGDDFDRRQGIVGVGDGADEQLVQLPGPTEEDLALVGEVPEERALRQSCALGDLGNGRAFEPALTVERKSCLLEPRAPFRLPSDQAQGEDHFDANGMLVREPIKAGERVILHMFEVSYFALDNGDLVRTQAVFLSLQADFMFTPQTLIVTGKQGYDPLRWLT